MLLITTCLSSCNSGSGQTAPGQNQLQIVKGKTFEKLPSGSVIQTLAKATVGITIKQGVFDSFGCTGVAISEQLLLTANHCTIEVDKKSKEFGNKYFNVNDSITLTLPDGITKTVKVEQINRGWSEKKYSMLDGDDLAIIKFAPKTFKSYVDRDKILSVKGADPSVFIDVVADKIWGRKSTLYVFGWGSHKRFEYDEQSGSPVKFPVNLGGVRDKASSGSIIPTYNISGTKDRYSRWLKDYSTPDNVYVVKKLENQSKEQASLTNLVEYGINIEGGDSGGPIFICDNVGNSCWLLAVNSFGNATGEGVGFNNSAVTLANPFYDLIAKPFNF